MRSSIGAASELPPGWEQRHLGEIAELRLGRTPPRADNRYWSDGSFPWVSIADLNDAELTHTREKVSEIAMRELLSHRINNPGTLLLSFKLTIGRVGILAMPAVTNEAIAAVIPDERIAHRDFLFYALRLIDYAIHKDAYVKGATLNKKKLLELPVDLPPIEEQQAIAQVLHTVQRAKEETKGVVSAVSQVRQAALVSLLHRGLGGGNRDLKASPIGEIPSDWHLCKFEDVVAVRNGQVDPRTEPYASMVHVGPENIVEGTGQLRAEKTAAELNLVSGKYLFDEGDVLYSKIRPYLRKVGRPDFAGVCSADMYPLRPAGDELGRGFLFHYLLSPLFTQQAVSHQSRTGIPKINRQQLGGILVPIPKRSEQEEIENVLDAIDAKRDAEQQSVDALDEVFRTLLRQLVSGQDRLKGPWEVP